MHHTAIDLGGRESQVCIRDEKGQVVREERVPTDALKPYLKRLRPGRIVLETCAEAFSVADTAKELGWEVRVVPATLVKSLGVGSRRKKNDVRDAQVLSEVSCRIDLPSVHIPAKTSREWKSRLGMREALVQSRTRFINGVKGWMRAEAIQLRGGRSEHFPKRVRDRFGDKLPSFVERQLQSIDFLSEQIAEATTELEKLARENEVCARLMTVPGVGILTALSFVAAIDDVSRFENAHQLESYLGLVPGEYSSSERRRMLSITKAGSSRVRWTLVQASWCLKRLQSESPVGVWFSGIEQRRGSKVAVVALARKLAGILYAMWRDGTTYDPLHAAKNSDKVRTYKLKAA